MKAEKRYLFYTCILYVYSVQCQLGASPEISEVSTTATFSWKIPQGATSRGLSFYALSPAGIVAFILTSTGTFIPTSNYAERITFLGNITSLDITFTLSNIQTSDAGNYTCALGGGSFVIDNCGQKLIVLGKPTAPGRPVSSTTPVYNRPLTLTCSSTSTTVPADHGLTLTYIWQKDGSEVSVEDGSSYRFTVGTKDRENYRCRSRESQGLESDWSPVYTMEPQFIPEVTVETQGSCRPYTVYASQLNVKLRCQVTASNPVVTSYIWTHNGTIIPSASSGVYTMSHVTRSSGGSYTCAGRNSVGTSISPQSVQVLVKDLAPQPEDILAWSTDSDTIKVSWKVFPVHGLQQQYLIEYKEPGKNGWIQLVTREDLNCDRYLQEELSNLLPETLYVIRMMTVTALGNSSFSEDIRVFTKESSEHDHSSTVSTDSNGGSGSQEAVSQITGAVLIGVGVTTIVLGIVFAAVLIYVFLRRKMVSGVSATKKEERYDSVQAVGGHTYEEVRGSTSVYQNSEFDAGM